MRLFTVDNFRKVVKELYNTLSNSTSRLSSKRIERLAFTTISIALVVSCQVYLIRKGTLTSTDTVMLASVLLVAGGYNLAKGQQEKKDEQN
mgnify:FL=1|tara:strand:- start:9919 stop:10191 length:273 start_codon:yes stop_codon:yes gene_type:complete